MESGWFVLRQWSGKPVRAWCDFDTTDGGGWTIGVVTAASPPPADAAAYRSMCADQGFGRAGMGVEELSAWLAQKRMLWNSNHPLRQDAWPTGGPMLTMPVMYDAGVGGQASIHPDAGAISLPSNRGGDRCHTGATEPYCGYWINLGWSDADLSAYPDPEDWYGAFPLVSLPHCCRATSQCGH